MQFFLYEIVARIVAAYLLVDCYRKVRDGFADRTIASDEPDPISAMLNWSNRIVDRDIAPVRFWIEIVIQVGLGISCLVVTIFGWWHPNA